MVKKTDSSTLAFSSTVFISNTLKIILSYPFTDECCHLYRKAPGLPIFLDKEA